MDTPGPLERTTSAGGAGRPPSPAVVEWYAVDRSTPLACVCGWAGSLGETAATPYRELVEYACPDCDAHLVVRDFPTLAEGIARGNPWALARQAREDRWARDKLVTPDQLPELPGERLVFTMTLEEPPARIDLTVPPAEPAWFVIRCGGHEVWREIAWYESLPRFHEIEALFRRRYGVRFGGLFPDRAAEFYLIGDRLTWELPVPPRPDPPAAGSAPGAGA